VSLSIIPCYFLSECNKQSFIIAFTLHEVLYPIVRIVSRKATKHRFVYPNRSNIMADKNDKDKGSKGGKSGGGKSGGKGKSGDKKK
jgi:hypothetical protein